MLAKQYALAHRHKVVSSIPSLKELLAKLSQTTAKELLPNETFTFSKQDVNSSREVLHRLLDNSSKDSSRVVPLIRVLRP